MAKTEVYSWRLSPDLKSRLENVAREEQQSLAELLGAVTEEWLEHRHDGGTVEERQAAMRSAAAPFIGAIRGGRADRSERARWEVRSRLAARRGPQN